jgi:GT2 family glycosyltransferase
LPSTIAVVILNWNGIKYLQTYLPSVRDTAYPGLRIIVADNGSTDDSVVFLQREFPEVELIRLDKNYGFAGGYNKALQLVDADYYVLLNSDVRVTPGWLTPLVQLMDSDPAIAACQPKLLAETMPGYFEYAGAAGGWLDAFGYPFGGADVCLTFAKRTKASMMLQRLYSGPAVPRS